MEAAMAARVLIVDDSADVRQMLALMLGASGRFEVVGEARNGREGVELAGRLRPDVVLLDLAMPVMDGLEALPLIRLSCKEARIIVFSGFDGPALKEQILSLGACGFVTKGVSSRELLLMIAQVLQRPIPAAAAVAEIA